MGDDLIGRKISVETFEGIYTGIIHGVDAKNKKLILNKVSLVDGRKLRGLQIFFNSDIKNLNLLPDEQSTEEADLASSNINGNKAAEEHEEKEVSSEEDKLDQASAKDPSDDGPKLMARKPMAPNRFLAGEECFVKRVPKEEMQDPPEVVLIDEFGDNFDSAVNYINEQRVVGLAADGENIGRNGKLCLLTIGSRKCTYVFDVYKLGEKCFPDGLTSILENPYLLKVIHDCRFLSDCLHHQYKTKMLNIFDTQVADIIIYKQKRGKLPKAVNGILPCLYEYLNLKESQCKFQTILTSFYKRPQIWTSRPLPRKLVNAVAEKVLYLRELRITQTENMLAEFLHGVNIYLDVFRSASKQNRKSLTERSVPAAFSRLRNTEERRWRKYEQIDKKIEQDDSKVTVNEDESKVPVNETNQSWTEGTEFASSYQKRHGKIIERNEIGRDRVRANVDVGKGTESYGVPWDSIRKARCDSSEGGKSEEELVYISESKVQEKKKQAKSVGKENKSPYTETKSLNKRSTFSYKETESPYTETTSPYKGTTSPYEETTSPYKEAKSPYKETQSADQGDSYSKDEEFNEDRPSVDINFDRKAQNNNEGSSSHTLSYVKSRKPPIDWFDCDTPSTDRSRSSSFDAGQGAKSKDHSTMLTPEVSRYRTTSNNSSYDDEFPKLSPENQKKSPKLEEYTDFKQQIQPDDASRDLFGNRGVRNKSLTPEPRGRAKVREMHVTRTGSPSSGMFTHLPRQFLGKNSVAFPSDNDLLNTKPIIETDNVDVLPGQRVKLQKIPAK